MLASLLRRHAAHGPQKILAIPCRSTPIRTLHHSSALLAATSTAGPEKQYSQTLQLPRTEFPLRANAAQRDPLFRERCTDRLYAWQQKRVDAPEFILHDGPPYANGSLHTGHALNKILKDIIIRYKLLCGYRVNYVPGWDCHGLPIEQKVMSALKASEDASEREHLTPVQVRERARKHALAEVDRQREQFRAWSIMGDWKNSYLTLAPEYESRQLRVFGKMVQKGLIYRHYKPVYWSPSSRTALAEAELEYKEDHRSRSVYVLYPLDKPSQRLAQLAGSERVSACIWTTTPWTLPANRAIAVNAALKYSVVRVATATADGDGAPSLLIICSDRLEALRNMLEQHGSMTIVGELDGKDLAGSQYQQPFSHQACQVLAAEHVTSVSGTGLVHTAPAHGQEDFALCNTHGIDLINCVDDKGRFTETAGAAFNGLPVLNEGTDAVIEWLREHRMLLHEQSFTHSYPYDWRTRKPVILRATWQWFANVTDIRERAIEAIATVKTIPDKGTQRLVGYLKGRSEWCISRQRAWGVPIPVFYDSTSGEPAMDSEIIAHVADLVEKHGTDCWWTMPTEDLLPESYRTNGKKYTRGTDTMDVWFDSGTSWTQFPERSSSESRTDVYLEGSDQHRGWFQSSLLTSVAVNGHAPFGTLITHGFLLDEHGRKMSKSLGNTVEPSTIVHGGKDKKKEPAYGTDILRLWVASTEYVHDVAMGRTIIANVAESMRKYRGTARFILGSLNDFSHNDCIDYDQLLPVDRYILSELHQFNCRVTDAYDHYAFSKVVQELNRFTNAQLSAFYFEVIKDRLYADGPCSVQRRSAQTVLYYILEMYKRALAPITCHLAEEIQTFVPAALAQPYDSVFQANRMPVDHRWSQPALSRDWLHIRSVRAQFNVLVERARQAKRVKSAAETELILYMPTATPLYELLSQQGEHLAHVLLCSACSIVQQHAPLSTEDGNILASEPLTLTDSTDTAGCHIVVRRANRHKCPRCWCYHASVEHSLCERCASLS